MIARAAVTVIAVALAGSASAHGAPSGAGWAITEADPAVAPMVPLSLAPGGRVLLKGSECDATTCSTVLATHAPGGPFERAARLRDQIHASTPLRAGAALLVTSPFGPSRLTAVDVTPAGRVARSAVLERRRAADVAIASDRRGTAAVAWRTTAAPWRLRVRVRRRDGGAFGRARTIASFRREDDFGNAALAVGARGEVAALWAADGAVRSRVLRRGARRFGPALRAGRSDRVARIAAAYTAGGTLAAIWSSADAGEEQDRVAIVRVAGLRPGAGRFARSVRLGEGADRETLVFGHGMAVRAVAAGRTANVAWTTRSMRVRLATLHADGSVTAARTLDARGTLADAAGSWTGRALFTWTHDPLGPSSAARAVLRLTPAMLGSIEPAGPAGSRATAAVLDDAATRALVTWGAGDPVLSNRRGIAERRVP
jgi:hypothetical protein